jgi:hypothetical protein
MAGSSGKKLNTEDLLINPSDNHEYYATFFLCRKHWVMHRKSRGGITISPLIPWQIKIMNAADLHPGLRAPLLKLEQQILQRHQPIEHWFRSQWQEHLTPFYA